MNFKHVLNISLYFVLYGISNCFQLCAQRDSLYGLDSTILAFFQYEESLYWPNGKLRSHFVEQDSVIHQMGYRDNGAIWFDAEYQAILNTNGDTVRGLLLKYKEFFRGSSIVKTSGNLVSYEDSLSGFVPVEEWKTYYPSGILGSITQFSRFNDRCGVHQEYHENGRISLAGQYCVRNVPFDPSCIDDIQVGEMVQIFYGTRSMPCGVWERYDPCGEIMEVITYDWKY